MVAPAADFKTLKVIIQAPTRYSKHLFIKPHSSQADDLPAGRALFVAGIPLSIAAEDVAELFSAFGDVANLAIHPSNVSRTLPACAPHLRNMSARGQLVSGERTH